MEGDTMAGYIGSLSIESEMEIGRDLKNTKRRPVYIQRMPLPFVTGYISTNNLFVICKQRLESICKFKQKQTALQTDLESVCKLVL